MASFTSDSYFTSNSFLTFNFKEASSTFNSHLTSVILKFKGFKGEEKGKFSKTFQEAVKP